MDEMDEMEFAETLAERNRRAAKNPHYTQTWEVGKQPEDARAIYTCNECGAKFAARWRSSYSPNPPCPTCGSSDRLSYAMISD